MDSYEERCTKWLGDTEERRRRLIRVYRIIIEAGRKATELRRFEYLDQCSTNSDDPSASPDAAVNVKKVTLHD